jgi:hypothetical protein
MDWVRDKDRNVETFCPIELRDDRSFTIHVGLSIIGQIPPSHKLIGEFSMIEGKPDLLIYKEKENEETKHDTNN